MTTIRKQARLPPHPAFGQGRRPPSPARGEGWSALYAQEGDGGPCFTRKANPSSLAKPIGTFSHKGRRFAVDVGGASPLSSPFRKRKGHPLPLLRQAQDEGEGGYALYDQDEGEGGPVAHAAQVSLLRLSSSASVGVAIANDPVSISPARS